MHGTDTVRAELVRLCEELRAGTTVAEADHSDGGAPSQFDGWTDPAGLLDDVPTPTLDQVLAASSSCTPTLDTARDDAEALAEKYYLERLHDLVSPDTPVRAVDDLTIFFRRADD